MRTVFAKFLFTLYFLTFLMTTLAGYILGSKIALLAVALVMGFLTFVFSQLLATRIKRPIDRMTKIISALDNGEMINVTTFHQEDEIGNLGRSIVAMASRNTAVEEANKDPLTGLANRRYLMQWLEDNLKDGKPSSLMFIDLDKFKPVNDTHGHEVGDEALKKMAEVMGTCVRNNDLLARIGGDEFVMVFKGLDNTNVLEDRAKKVIELVSTPFWVGDIRVKLGASIGIGLFPKDATDAEGLLNTADEAMYAVKKAGRNNFKFYS